MQMFRVINKYIFQLLRIIVNDYDKSHQENQTQPLEKQTSHMGKLKRQRLGFCNCLLNRLA